MVRVSVSGSQLASDEVVMIQNLQNGSYQSETPTGTINGVNTVFTLSAAPSPAASLKVFLNGAFQTGGGEDYTLVTDTITFVSAPDSQSVLRAYYLRDA